MPMETRDIQIGQKPTPEVLNEVEKAAGRPIKYAEDAPRLGDGELAEFVPYQMVDHNLYKPKKVQISLRIDADIIEAFRRQGSGYQTKINEALRYYVCNRMINQKT